MGLEAKKNHSITSILVGLAAIVLVIIAILMLLAKDKIKEISGFDNNVNLNDIESKLNTAVILAWVAAAIAVLLALGYLITGLADDLTKFEWVHLILWILLFGTLIASLVILGMVISDLDNLNLGTDEEASSALSYMWWSMGLGIAAGLFLFFSGAWRVYGVNNEAQIHAQKQTAQIHAQKQTAQFHALSTSELPSGVVHTFPSQQFRQV